MHLPHPTLRAARLALVLAVRAWCHFLEGFDMWERVGLGLKLAVIVVCLGFFLQGRPPAAAQDAERILPGDPTIGVLATETALQQHDLVALSLRLKIAEDTLKLEDARIYSNAGAIDNLNTKWLCAVAVLGFLQSSGLLAQLLAKKKTGA